MEAKPAETTAPVQPTPAQTTQLQPNVAGALCYILGWVSGLIFFLIEKNDKTVRFHAVQSMIISGSVTVLQMVLAPLFMFVPGVSLIYVSLISWLAFVLLIVLVVKTYQGEKLKLPIAGDIAEQITK